MADVTVGTIKLWDEFWVKEDPHKQGVLGRTSRHEQNRLLQLFDQIPIGESKFSYSGETVYYTKTVPEDPRNGYGTIKIRREASPGGTKEHSPAEEYVFRLGPGGHGIVIQVTQNRPNGYNVETFENIHTNTQVTHKMLDVSSKKITPYLTEWTLNYKRVLAFMSEEPSELEIRSKVRTRAGYVPHLRIDADGAIKWYFSLANKADQAS